MGVWKKKASLFHFFWPHHHARIIGFSWLPPGTWQYNSKISRKHNTNQLSNHMAKWHNILTIFQLVVSSQLKNISQIGASPLVRVKIKNVWYHHLVFHQPRFPENEGSSLPQLPFGGPKPVWGSRANLTRNIAMFLGIRSLYDLFFFCFLLLGVVFCFINFRVGTCSVVIQRRKKRLWNHETYGRPPLFSNQTSLTMEGGERPLNHQLTKTSLTYGWWTGKNPAPPPGIHKT